MLNSESSGTLATMMTHAAEAASQPWDVAVIGAGVFGSWTAYHLATSGKRVLLLDAYGPANSRASSGGETRVIRLGYGPDEIYTRLAARSLTLWEEHFAAVGQPQLLQKTGVLWMAAPEHRSVKDTRVVFQRLGITFEELTPGQMADRYPQIRQSPNSSVLFEPNSGALLARRGVQSVAARAGELGVKYLQEAVQPVSGKQALKYVQTRAGTRINAQAYVFACGPWLPKVLPDVLGNMIFPTRQEVFFFGPPPGDSRFAPPALPVWADYTDERIPYGFPDLESRGFKLAFDRHGSPFDPDMGNRQIDEAAICAAREYIALRFPGLADAPVVETRVCQYENTSNGDFIIDQHPQLENVWLVGGGSGHGFKHGPAIGEYVAQRVDGHIKPEPRFSLANKTTVQQRSIY